MFIVKEYGLFRLYIGGLVFCIFNVLKLGIRFFIFDVVWNVMLKDVFGKIIVLGNFIVGFCVGVVESIIVFIFGENFKMWLIDDIVVVWCCSRFSIYVVWSMFVEGGFWSFFWGVLFVMFK